MRSLVLLVPCLLLSCSQPQPTPTQPAAAQGAAPAASEPVVVPVLTGATASVAVTAPNPALSASAPAADSPAPSASAAPPAASHSDWDVTNIGMHIGGGPNDEPTKEPIRNSVSPHNGELLACFEKAEATKGGDFGIDLRIPKAGGKAQVSHPRTAIKGEEFKSCVVKVFEAVDFVAPKKGETVVSYSIRFSKKKR